MKNQSTFYLQINLQQTTLKSSYLKRDNQHELILLPFIKMARFSTFHNQPITRQQILDSSKLIEFADNNFRFDENERKLSKRIENTVGKGEIARYSVFKRFVTQGRQKVSLCGNGLKTFVDKNLTMT